MTNEEINELKGLAASMGLYDDKTPCKRAVILGKAIKALEQEPCDNAINRQAAIDEIRKCRFVVDAIEKIRVLPPVTPHQKTGRWIYDYVAADGHRVYHCSECGCYLKPKHSEPLNIFKWCTLCGAKMLES